MDLRTKIAAQVGNLLISNIELTDQLEEMHAQNVAQKQRADKLQAEAEAAAKAAADAAAAQQAHDASVDAHDLPSGALAPMDIPTPNVVDQPA